MLPQKFGVCKSYISETMTDSIEIRTGNLGVYDQLELEKNVDKRFWLVTATDNRK